MMIEDTIAIFSAGPFPMLGNLDTGYVIGLSPEGARICTRMQEEDVSEEEIAAVDGNLLVHLKAGGFIADGSASPASTPNRSAYLHVTHSCNLDCTGCYSRRSGEHGPDLTLEKLELAVKKLADRGVRRLIISGGEPFLRKDLAKLVKFAKNEASMESVDILSNGTLITLEALSGLAGYADRICISFDGLAPDAEALIRKEQRFDSLVDAISMIKEAGIPAHIIATIHRKNAQDIPAYKELAAQLGTTVNFSLLSAPEATPELNELIPDDDAMADLAHVLFGCATLSSDPNGGPLSTTLSACALCGAGNKSLSVAADGTLYPCHMLHYDEVRMGSILDDAMEDACANNPFEGLTVDGIDECASCDIRYLCGGGCRARAFYATKDPKQRDPYCALMKEHYSILFDALSKMNA